MRKGFRLSAVALVFVVFLWLPVAAHENHSKKGGTEFTKHFNESVLRVTGHGLFSIEIMLDDSEYDIGKNVIGIALHDANDEDVVSAGLVFSVRDMDSGAPVPLAYKIQDKGGGLYIVSGLDLVGQGKNLKLSVTAQKDGVSDTAVFLFPDILAQRRPKGKISR